MMSKPHKSIKRHEALISFSREHRTGLMLCWNLKMGLKKNVDIDRMKSYINFMWKYHLHKHFSDEGIFLFPILNNDDRLITRAIEDHINITSLFKDDRCSNQTLASIAHKLEEHIRYEERILFNTIQDHLSDQQIKALLSRDRDIACGLWEDKFWK